MQDFIESLNQAEDLLNEGRVETYSDITNLIGNVIDPVGAEIDQLELKLARMKGLMDRAKRLRRQAREFAENVRRNARLAA